MSVRVIFENSETVVRVSEDVRAVQAAIDAAVSATASAASASASETATENFALQAEGFANQTEADAIATAADRVQTGLDVQATNADAVATAADRVQTGLDAIATAADRVQTGLDAQATAADVLLTSADVITTGQAVTDAQAAQLAAEGARDLAIDAKDDAETAKLNAVAAAASVESTILALGSISGTVNIDLALGTLVTATLTGTTTLTFSGLPPSTRETDFTLRFAGLEQINLPAGTKYANGEVPTPEGALYEIPCTINNGGDLIVYGVINDIKTP